MRNDRAISLTDRRDRTICAKFNVVDRRRCGIVVDKTSFESRKNRHWDDAVDIDVDIVVDVASTDTDIVVINYISIVIVIDNIVDIIIHSVRLENVGRVIVIVVNNNRS